MVGSPLGFNNSGWCAEVFNEDFLCGDAVYIISEESRLEECLEEDASVVSGVLEADFLLLEAVVVMVRSWWCWCPL